MRGLFVALLISTFCLGYLNASVSTWNKLKVTWGVSPFTSYYKQPVTVDDAVSQGYVKISDCDLKAAWRGARYVKDGDRALTLLFDVKGRIAGIQKAVPTNTPNGYPAAPIRPPFVRDGDYWVTNAYFTDPATICTTGRSDSSFQAENVGDNLFIQQGVSPEASMKIPRDEKDVEGTLWTKGKCFATMGQHYWWNLSDDMSCDAIFPYFLLYNGGKLNGFGFAFIGDLESKYYEHPPNDVLTKFMVSVPKCLLTIGTLSTMHTYLSDWVLTNWC